MDITEFPITPSFDEAIAALDFDDEVQRLVLQHPDVRAVHQSLSDLYGSVRNEMRTRGVVPITLLGGNRQVIERCARIGDALEKVGEVVEWMVEKAVRELAAFHAFEEKPAEPEPVKVESTPPLDPIPPIDPTPPQGAPPATPEGQATEGQAAEADPPAQAEGDQSHAEAPEGQADAPSQPQAEAQAAPQAADPSIEPEPQAPPSTNRGKRTK